MFLPPVVLAIRSRYVLEAAVYTFTMFFSTVCGAVHVCTESLAVMVGEGLRFHHGPPWVWSVSLHCSLQQGFPTASYHGIHRTR